MLSFVSRELKQIGRRQGKKHPTFPYLKMKNRSFARLAFASFIFVNLGTVLVLSTR